VRAFVRACVRRGISVEFNRFAVAVTVAVAGSGFWEQGVELSTFQTEVDNRDRRIQDILAEKEKMEKV
jgi:hypothetical protein